MTSFGTDPSLPTFGDNSETGIGGKIWGLMLGPPIALIVIGFLLRSVIGFQRPAFLLVPVALGILWIMIYIIYLVVKSGGYKDSKTGKAN
jgi:hypothetical protein